MHCPLCKINLEKSLFYNTEINYCPKCLGVFFDESELQEVKDAKDTDLRWLDVDLWKEPEKFKFAFGERLCPKCRLPFYEVRYADSKIIVDVCNICRGIWLDRGEFKKIIDYLKEKANYEVLYNYAKNLKEEAFEIFSGPESFKEEFLDFVILLKFLNYKLATQNPKIAKMLSELPKF